MRTLAAPAQQKAKSAMRQFFWNVCCIVAVHTVAAQAQGGKLGGCNPPESGDATELTAATFDELLAGSALPWLVLFVECERTNSRLFSVLDGAVHNIFGDCSGPGQQRPYADELQRQGQALRGRLRVGWMDCSAATPEPDACGRAINRDGRHQGFPVVMLCVYCRVFPCRGPLIGCISL